MTPDRSHDAIARRLPLYVADMLDEADARAVAEHVAACDDCRDAVQALRERDTGPGADAGHLPADLVATWPRRAPALAGFERRLVREHLARCAACRADLALLGHSPELVADVEAERAAAGRIVHAEDAFRERRVRRWLPGLLATAASLIVVSALVLRPHAPAVAPPVAAPPAPAPAAPHVPPAPPAAAAPSLAFTLAPAPAGARLLALAEDVRGLADSTARPPRVTLGPESREAHFAVPATLLQADLPESLDVQLVSPAGRVLRTARVASHVLYPHRMITVHGGPGTAPAGTYRVRFRLGTRNGVAQVRDYAFTLRR